MSSRFIVSKRQRFRLCDSTPSVCHGGMLGAGVSRPAPATEPRRAGQNSRAKAVLTLWIDTTAHRASHKRSGCRITPHPRSMSRRLRKFTGSRVRRARWRGSARAAHQHTRSLPRSSCSAAMSAGCRTIHARYFAMTSSREPSWPITNGCPICWGDRRRGDPASAACRPVGHRESCT